MRGRRLHALHAQAPVGGGTVDLRDDVSLHVLAEQPDGEWLIVSELYRDARTDAAYTA